MKIIYNIYNNNKRMSNDFIISDDLYLILLRYFDGDIININSKIIKDLKKGKFQKKEVSKNCKTNK